MTEHEYRFSLDPAHAGEVLSAAAGRLTPVARNPFRPIVYLRTVYLDSLDGRFLRSAHLSADGTGADGGAEHRVRLRQYATAANVDETPRISSGVFFEMKRISGVRRFKVRVELDSMEAGGLMAGRPSASALAAVQSVPGLSAIAGELARRELAPRVMTWFRRVALVGEDLRVTLDEAVTYCRAEPPLDRGAIADPHDALVREPRATLEVKTRGEALPDWLRSALAQVPLEVGASKYRSAMAAVAGIEEDASGAGTTVPLPILGVM